VTNRANSVLSAGSVDDIEASVNAAERWYAARGLPTVFQVSPGSPRSLPVILAARDYREHSHTDILVADRDAVAASSAPPSRVSVAAEPAPGWLDTWWAVDGRGGTGEQAIVARILAGGSALYAWAGEPAVPDAVGRLALVDGWGGLYAVATLPAARRRGLARDIALALAAASADHGVSRLWLQVVADNATAHSLYASLGFVRASHYTYWTSRR
jgi:ribosomal protein S18 acetylase RimI-like enzyme